jgi:hypothetical protein
MKYFIDTEFIEGKIPQQIKGIDIPKWLSNPLPNIQMISVGIVSEEYHYADAVSGGSLSKPEKVFKQKEYYAISKDFNLRAAWNNEWVRENVLLPIHKELLQKEISNNDIEGKLVLSIDMLYKDLKRLLNKYGKTNKQIAQEIIEFVNPNIDYIFDKATKADAWCDKFYPNEFNYIKQHNTHIMPNIIQNSYQTNEQYVYNQPEFYGYCSDYDWVVFCQLFGTMLDLPKGFPKFAFDLKQTLNEKALVYDDDQYSNLDISGKIEYLKTNSNYPKQTNEHNALDDARWNYQLYKFLNTL